MIHKSIQLGAFWWSSSLHMREDIVMYNFLQLRRHPSLCIDMDEVQGRNYLMIAWIPEPGHRSMPKMAINARTSIMVTQCYNHAVLVPIDGFITSVHAGYYNATFRPPAMRRLGPLLYFAHKTLIVHCSLISWSSILWLDRYHLVWYHLLDLHLLQLELLLDWSMAFTIQSSVVMVLLHGKLSIWYIQLISLGLDLVIIKRLWVLSPQRS
jgi:hypothetical protein